MSVVRRRECRRRAAGMSRGNAAVTQIPNFLFNYRRARRLSFLTAAQIHQTPSLLLEGRCRSLGLARSQTTGLWLRANHPALSAVTWDFFSPLGLGRFSAVSGAQSLARTDCLKWCAMPHRSASVSLEIVGRKCRQLTPPFPVLVLHPPRPSPTHLLASIVFPLASRS